MPRHYVNLQLPSPTHQPSFGVGQAAELVGGPASPVVGHSVTLVLDLLREIPPSNAGAHFTPSCCTERSMVIYARPAGCGEQQEVGGDPDSWLLASVRWI
jgi:hypothetical protein